MTRGKKPAKAANEKKRALEVTLEGLRKAAGSDSDDVQIELLEQVIATTWQPKWKSDEDKVRAAQAAYDALKRIAPRSELEGMLAGQMIATHNAAMECLRRAMIEGQGFESRDQNLKHAVRLMGLYERQLAALDKHRGKGRQKITVEHVNVHAGGQAIVGDVNASEAALPSPAAGPLPQAAPPALADESAVISDGESLREALSAKAPTPPTRARK